MTPATRGARRPQPLRLWWALPVTAVAGTAVGMAVVVGPTLGERVTVPRQLVLPVTSTTTPATPAPTNSAKPAAHPSPKPSLTPSSTPLPKTHVVVPRRPVVTASNDDAHEHESGTDTSGTDTSGNDR